ncbi:MAG: flagellar basal body-associated FliL family protein [Oligoflexia bacterium]|nr:flagellar basal body-associated FliL family protein [Oligoflexia bacterium]
MAQGKTGPKDEVVAVPKPGLREKLPKILMGIFVGLNLAVMIGGTFMIYTIKIAYHRPTITEETETQGLGEDRDIREDKPVLYSFEPFTVNLDGRPRKLVRTTIQLEMLSEEGYEEVVNQSPIARDQIVRILNAKTYEDIETIQGKLFLKNQIITALNGMLSRGSIKEIYFGEFVVQ